MKTPVQNLLGLDWPVIQGPFGGGSTVKLTALVSNLGGLGSFGAYMMTPDAIASTIAEIKAATSKPFNINLWVSDHDPGGLKLSPEEFDQAFALYEPFYKQFGLDKPAPPKASYHPRFEDQVEVILETRPPVFSFVFGIPSTSILSECRTRGIVTVGAATTLPEAEALDTAGVDCIIASGFEAAGHRPSFLARAEDSLMGTMALPRVVASKINTPVIPAGGIADGEGVRAALQLGAGAAQIGTAFFACEESGASELQRAALFDQRARTSKLTRAFSGRLARGIPNRTMLEMEKLQGRLPPFPVHSWFMAKIRAAALTAGDPDWVSLYGGQAAALVKHRAAADLMKNITGGL
ncbi:MAG: nitronate monooxygenase [Caulobacterales bacterium]